MTLATILLIDPLSEEIEPTLSIKQTNTTTHNNVKPPGKK
jgi:hypothetical protein